MCKQSHYTRVHDRLTFTNFAISYNTLHIMSTSFNIKIIIGTKIELYHKSDKRCKLTYHTLHFI